MPIRFKCPNPECQKPLAVKEHLAGKKAACPACKKVMVIPAPVAPPKDLEAFAAAALGEEKPKTETKPAATIDFICPFCDAELHLSADLAGKQAPCTNPECRRIVKVPLPKDDKPKDWRTTKPAGPSGAMANQLPEPDGQWGTATSRGRVSQGSLIDADAMPVTVEPVGVAGWIRRVVWLASLGGLVVLAIWGIGKMRTQAGQKDAYARALAAVEPKSTLTTARTAAMYRGLGEFWVNERKAEQAREFLSKARNQFPSTDSPPANPEQDLLLTLLALDLVELGGKEQEGIDNERLDWKKDVVKNELAATLRQMTTESQIVALRLVANRLQARDKGEVGITLAGLLGASEERNVFTGQSVALLLQRSKEQAAISLPEPKLSSSTIDLPTRMGYAEGWARQGKFKEALALVKAQGSPLDQMQASLGVAALALDNSDDTVRKEAQPFVSEAVKIAESLKRKLPPPLLFQLVTTLAWTEPPEKVKEWITPLKEPHLSLAQLELVKAQLKKMDGAAPAALVDEITDRDSLARALACEWLARHNTRVSGGVGDFETIVGGDNDPLQAFVHLGSALGTQNSKK